MGKAAENEGIKLRAAWLNNASVGLALGGVIVPYLAIVQTGYPIVLRELLNGTFDLHKMEMGEYQIPFYKLLATVLALIISGVFRRMARKEIAKIQD